MTMPRRVDTPSLQQGFLKGMDENLSILVLVRGMVGGRPWWVYARIPPSRYPAFLAVQEQGGYSLGDFASEILAQGEGASPPPDVAERMKKEGCDPAFEAEFQQLLEEAAALFEENGKK